MMISYVLVDVTNIPSVAGQNIFPNNIYIPFGGSLLIEVSVQNTDNFYIIKNGNLMVTNENQTLVANQLYEFSVMAIKGDSLNFRTSSNNIVSIRVVLNVT